MPEQVPDALTAAWERTVEAWDDPALHDKLLGLVATHNAYAWAAARYKSRGDDDAIAVKQLGRVKRSAELVMFSRPEKEAKNSAYKGTFTFLAVLLLLLVALVVFAILYQGASPE